MIQNSTIPNSKMDPVADLLLSEHPVAYRVSFAPVVGGAMPALLLSQMYYWSNNETARARPDNSFYMTQEEITVQTGLTRTETETARKKLREVGVLIEEKRGLPMKIWYRLDKNRLYELLSLHVKKIGGTAPSNLAENLQDGASDAPINVAGNLQDDSRKTCTPSCGKPASLDAGFPQDITETPTETSASTYTETTTTQAPALKAEPAPGSEARVVVSDEYVKNTNHDQVLVSKLTEIGITRRVAESLAATYPDRVENQIAYLPFRNIRDRAATLKASIEGNWSAPQRYLQAQEAASRQAREEQVRTEISAKLQGEQEERNRRKAAFEAALEALSHEHRGDLERQTWKVLARSSGPVAAKAKDVLRGDIKGGEAMFGNAVRAIFNSTLEKLVMGGSNVVL